MLLETRWYWLFVQSMLPVLHCREHWRTALGMWPVSSKQSSNQYQSIGCGVSPGRSILWQPRGQPTALACNPPLSKYADNTPTLKSVATPATTARSVNGLSYNLHNQLPWVCCNPCVESLVYTQRDHSIESLNWEAIHYTYCGNDPVPSVAWSCCECKKRPTSVSFLSGSALTWFIWKHLSPRLHQTAPLPVPFASQTETTA